MLFFALIPGFGLQGVILFVVLGKIQGLFLGGDPLGGIVFKFSALICRGFHTLLGAENQILVQLGAMGTIGTGRFDFLAKQHIDQLSFRFCHDYTPTPAGMLLFFRRIPLEKRRKARIGGINPQKMPIMQSP